MKILILKETNEAVLLGNFLLTESGVNIEGINYSQYTIENCYSLPVTSNNPPLELPLEEELPTSTASVTPPNPFVPFAWKWNEEEFELTENGESLIQEYNTIKLNTFANNCTVVIQRKLDNFARLKGYDNIISLCSYANSTNTIFSEEGITGVLKRDETWNQFYEIISQIRNNERPLPNRFQEIESELPSLIWEDGETL
jgi:hypothetical protein